MNAARFQIRRAAPVCLALLLVPAAWAARPASDLASPEQRRAMVQAADRLAHPAAPAALPAGVNTPFSPVDFDKPDPSEAREYASSRPASTGAKAPEAAAPLSDKDVLAAVVGKIPTTGTIILDGTPLLVSGTNRIEVGSRFTVVYNGQEYELELIAVNRTTFTVRYKGEEFTRPIK